ncbi:SDR family oxidoreductase [Leifsonia aquatica]|uniref:Oxidoreductase, short chain dehydrogenase/reductase family protein n=2 Tax=Leifsonia aquatica TaxID=144185 RepID=U2R4N9_LEIAQ|nr:SDR family oxidoreductase [Leifsonia aquatica]ERK70230.1 oxidoreductase, short chain dehydrogenase/reductase family protein [Leifsonia aquatica ATCC 14665]MBB2966059.1 NADP-dependent 3-hydroxy acid dehydrogenase YdfG [Leifsonia aquatica]
MTSTSRPLALVTGASRGIGKAIALDLGRTHHVLVGGRDAEAVDAVVAQLPSAEPFVGDLAAGELPPLPERLDVLVHSAGLEDGGTVGDTDLETWRRLFEVNVFAVAELSRLALPALRAAEGLVVVINSGSGLVSGPGGGPYAASKFAARALTDALREEERPHGVRVSSIHPGRVDTDMQRALVAREGHAYDTTFTITPEMVAATVRTAVDLPPSGTVESLSVRPMHRR